MGGIGINLVTAEHPVGYAWPLTIMSFTLALVGGLANLLYPYARGYFNKKKS